jgi:hypothetical protein
MEKDFHLPWSLRLENFLYRIPYSLGVLCDGLLQRRFGIRLPMNLVEAELGAAIRQNSVIYKGQRLAPHCFQICLGWQQFQTSSRHTIADWENALTTKIKLELQRGQLRTLVPLELQVHVDVFADQTSIRASFGKFTELINSRESRVTVQTEQGSQNYRLFIHCLNNRQELTLSFKAQERLYVGASPDCDVVLVGDAVSPLHAVLYLDTQGRLLLADVGSQAGTWAGDRKLRYGEAVVVGDDGRIFIGGVLVVLQREPG